MTQTFYVIGRNTIAFGIGLGLLWLGSGGEITTHDYALLGAATFIAGYIADNAISRRSRIDKGELP